MTTVQSRSLPLPPGNLGLPLLGETIPFLQDPDFAKKRQERYGTVFKTHVFGRPTVYLIGAEANRFIFSNENKLFSINWPYSTQVLLGHDSLSMQTGDIHKSRRKFLLQAFQPRALAGYAVAMQEIAHRYLQKWEQMGNLTWYPELRKYTFDVACHLFVGQDDASQTELMELFEVWCDGLFTIPWRLPGTKFSRALSCRQKLLQEIEKIILQRQHQPESGEDALGLLLNAQDEAGNRLSVEELKDQILLLLFAGHETLTSAVASMVLFLGQHPQVLEKVRLEQQQFSPSQPISFEDLKRMTYLEQVMKEVLRFMPPVGGAFREVIEPCEFQGYLIPKGWSVLYQVARTHQDSQIYTNPDIFDPDRFSEERSEDKAKAFSNIPFGGGMRECLGKEFARLEMKLLAALLARGYDWQILPNQNLELKMVPTPRPQDGLKVHLKTR